MSSKIILELGQNHLGNENDAKKIIMLLVKQNIYGITLQIREKAFYKKFPNFLLKDEFYFEMSEIIKKNKKNFGIALCKNERLKLTNFLKVDFYKVINKGLCDNKLMKYLFNTNAKKIFVSLGDSTDEEIDKNYTSLNKNDLKKLFYVYTKNSSKNYSGIKSYSSNNKKIKLDNITKIKNKYKVPVAFGNHFTDKKIIFNSLKFKPAYLFLYVKGNRKLNYPDNQHAISLRNIKKYISKLNSNL